jgi:cell wall-associated NlpC family hydrolase
MMHWKYLYSIVILAVLQACSSAPPRGTIERGPAIGERAAPMSLERAEGLIQALSALGVDYQYGGRSHATGFDCSGLVAHVYRAAWGIELPHNAAAQAEAGSRVSLAELQAGDLVFYNTLNRPFSHVGIYLGDGRFVHAPKTGASVRVEQMESAYWMRRFDGARRYAMDGRRF